MEKKEPNITPRFKKGDAFVEKVPHPLVFMEVNEVEGGTGNKDFCIVTWYSLNESGLDIMRDIADLLEDAELAVYVDGDAAEELLEYLGKESVYSGHFDEVWSEIEANVNHKSVDELFLQQINNWRLMLGKEILNCNPEIEMEELGDVVQSYINKILFLRVCEDRNIETYKDLLAIADGGIFDKLLEKFKKADAKYNSGLFDQALSEQVVCNASSKMPKPKKKNDFLPIYLEDWNKYITFVA